MTTPDNIAEIPISAFKNALSTEPSTVKLGAFLNSQRHKENIMALRQQSDVDIRNQLKKKLPAATISGTFTRRNIAGIHQYNGLVCMDFDGKENPTHTAVEMRNLLAGFDEVAYAALSVGGAGCFAIVPTNNTDPEQHGRVVDVLGKIFAQFNLIYDRTCKDVSRLRFVSYDPDAWWNPAPIVFDAIRVLKKMDEKAAEKPIRPPRSVVVRQPSTNDRTRRRVEDFIMVLEQSCRDITSNYDDWIHIGFALASEFGMEGAEYFHRISFFNPKYDRAECEKKYYNLMRSGRQVKIATFFKILKDQGITL
jgi:hypothetical protein